ncbi:hypothetical protein [Urinicoccus massiliensis]|uniref:hypothetical protein n=1 Tax=Urinicoccus massiliensis TaxID=1723382 RepID=UPI0009312792|nr:hypothetical protein [Urinicoccus massiliensis]
MESAVVGIDKIIIFLFFGFFIFHQAYVFFFVKNVVSQQYLQDALAVGVRYPKSAIFLATLLPFSSKSLGLRALGRPS